MHQKDTSIGVGACELVALRAGFLACGIARQLIALRQSISIFKMRKEAYTFMSLSMHLSHLKDDVVSSVETGFGSTVFLCGSIPRDESPRHSRRCR
jgi:hypothetical protein